MRSYTIGPDSNARSIGASVSRGHVPTGVAFTSRSQPDAGGHVAMPAPSDDASAEPFAAWRAAIATDTPRDRNAHAAARVSSLAIRRPPRPTLFPYSPLLR